MGYKEPTSFRKAIPVSGRLSVLDGRTFQCGGHSAHGVEWVRDDHSSLGRKEVVGAKFFVISIEVARER